MRYSGQLGKSGRPGLLTVSDMAASRHVTSSQWPWPENGEVNNDNDEVEARSLLRWRVGEKKLNEAGPPSRTSAKEVPGERKAENEGRGGE